MRRCPQDIIFGDFGSTLGPHLGTSFGSFWAFFFDVFLICLLDGIFGDLGSIWALFGGPFLGTFLEACLNLYVNRDMHENTSI